MGGEEVIVGPLSVRPRRGKILLLLLHNIIALSSKSVQLITSDASQTHITIHFPKAGDTHNPLTHCPLPHHPHRPTLPTKSTHNSHDITIFHFLLFYTIQSIYFLNAGDTHNPLTHCPLHHHPKRPTLPTKSTHNSRDMI